MQVSNGDMNFAKSRNSNLESILQVRFEFRRKRTRRLPAARQQQQEKEKNRHGLFSFAWILEARSNDKLHGTVIALMPRSNPMTF